MTNIIIDDPEFQKELEAIDKKYGGGVVYVHKKMPIKKVDVISTGSIGLDYATGIGGIPRGKMIEKDGTDFRIDCAYINIPFLEDKVAIIVDPMLASGSTMLFLLKQLENQKPKKIIILSAIAAKFGIERISGHYPDALILAGAIDPILNEKGYIVPGLGDAGDRAFNT